MNLYSFAYRFPFRLALIFNDELVTLFKKIVVVFLYVFYEAIVMCSLRIEMIFSSQIHQLQKQRKKMSDITMLFGKQLFFLHWRSHWHGLPAWLLGFFKRTVKCTCCILDK